MERAISSPLLLRMARHRSLLTLAVAILSGALAVWAITQSPTPLGIVAWLLAPLLLAALVYSWLDVVYRLYMQKQAQTEMERQLATLEESNAAHKTVRQELAQQKKLAENLLAVARATGQQPILENMLQNVLDITAALTGTVHGCLFLLDPQGKVTQRLHTRQDLPHKPDDAMLNRIMQDGLAGWAVSNQQVARCQDTQKDSRWLERPEQAWKARSAISVPFINRGSAVGVLTLTHADPEHFTEAHERLLSNAADQISIALDNAKMFNTMLHMADRLGLLYTLNSIAAGANLDTILAESLHAIQRATHWPGLAVLLPESQGHTAQPFTLVTRSARGDNLPEELSINDGLVDAAWRTSETAIADSSRWGTILVAPICAEGYPLGVLLVKGISAQVFNAEDVELVSSAADTLAAAIVNAELRRQLEELSRAP